MTDLEKRIEARDLASKIEEAARKAHDKIDDSLTLKWEYVEAFKEGAKWALEYADTIKKHEFRYVEDIQIRANGTSNTVDVELTLES